MVNPRITTTSDRAGRYVRQLAGYSAFIPNDLPPTPAIDLSRLSLRQSEADQAIGRLDGIGTILPNPDLFVAMYVRREAVLSSQIEGTQSTLDDVLAFEVDASTARFPADVEEVVNHVRAMNYGLKRLETLPLSLRLIREIHGELMKGVRGVERDPGEFRTSQNWIGPRGGTLQDAAFVPPPAHELVSLLGGFEDFLRERGGLPALVHAGVAHAQFETIHPFLDGNGRIGRLLMTFLLVHEHVLTRPLLYLSYFLKRNRSEYYDRLMAVRLAGDWEGWLDFFLRGVAETAEDATRTAGAIVQLRETHRTKVAPLGSKAVHLLDILFERPIVNTSLVKTLLEVSSPTAGKLIQQFRDAELLEEITGQQRNRLYRYRPYVDLFADPDPADPQPDIDSLTQHGQAAPADFE